MSSTPRAPSGASKKASAQPKAAGNPQKLPTKTDSPAQTEEAAVPTSAPPAAVTPKEVVAPAVVAATPHKPSLVLPKSLRKPSREAFSVQRDNEGLWVIKYSKGPTPAAMSGGFTHKALAEEAISANTEE